MDDKTRRHQKSQIASPEACVIPVPGCWGVGVLLQLADLGQEQKRDLRQEVVRNDGADWLRVHPIKDRVARAQKPG